MISESISQNEDKKKKINNITVYLAVYMVNKNPKSQTKYVCDLSTSVCHLSLSARQVIWCTSEAFVDSPSDGSQ